MTFKKRIYVRIEKDGDYSYMIAEEQLENTCVDRGRKFTIGVYELKEKVIVQQLKDTMKDI